LRGRERIEEKEKGWRRTKLGSEELGAKVKP